jgi:hypothetical protein
MRTALARGRPIRALALQLDGLKSFNVSERKKSAGIAHQTSDTGP